jgi:hypothetical protein
MGRGKNWGERGEWGSNVCEKNMVFEFQERVCGQQPIKQLGQKQNMTDDTDEHCPSTPSKPKCRCLEY